MTIVVPLFACTIEFNKHSREVGPAFEFDNSLSFTRPTFVFPINFDLLNLNELRHHWLEGKVNRDRGAFCEVIERCIHVTDQSFVAGEGAYGLFEVLDKVLSSQYPPHLALNTATSNQHSSVRHKAYFEHT